MAAEIGRYVASAVAVVALTMLVLAVARGAGSYRAVTAARQLAEERTRRAEADLAVTEAERDTERRLFEAALVDDRGRG